MSIALTNIQKTAVDTIRVLSMDAVQTANSGHPGTPMALAPVAYQVWAEGMTYDPEQPNWPNRDRFVLSCGHASMLLYSILHLVGVSEINAAGKSTGNLAISLDAIKNFRQLGSPCAGHPEFGEAAGIETTTGPLGQGVANSVGMAIARNWLAARYNTADHTLFDYDIYAICSDGDLMEGIATEAASLAGHLKLSNLCWFYDDNHITIEGNTDLAFSEQIEEKFQGLGWNVLRVSDANDLEQLSRAISGFKECSDQPTLVIVRSIIGYGAPNKQDTHGAHGAPLGWDEVALAKAAYGFPEEERFLVPKGVREHFAEKVGVPGGKAYGAWSDVWNAYKNGNQEQAKELQAIFDGKLPEDWDAEIPVFEASEKGDATRNSSGKVLNNIAHKVPFMIGGSADLAPSNKSNLTFEGAGDFLPQQFRGRNLHFGIREHAMAAICNGISLSGLRAYGATFFVFTDYMRGAMRLSSLMHQPVLYILTHDSIGVGEDGPTHQPVEHLAACRAIPGLYVFRPGDANEVAQAYRVAMQTDDHPSAIILSRQSMPTLCREKYGDTAGVAQGAYVLADCDGPAEVILLGTGSELCYCVEAYETLAAEGIKARVVSVPCMDLFAEQSKDYRDQVLPPSCTARVACEAGIRQGWDAYLGIDGKFVGMTGFGASGPAKQVYEKYGITAATIVAEARSALHA